jgi:hypothetical protein
METSEPLRATPLMDVDFRLSFRNQAAGGVPCTYETQMRDDHGEAGRRFRRCIGEPM